MKPGVQEYNRDKCLKGKYSDLCIISAYQTEDGNHWLSGTVNVRKIHHLRRNRKTVPVWYCFEQKKWHTDREEKFVLCQSIMRAVSLRYLQTKGLNSLSELYDSLIDMERYSNA